MMAHTDKTRVYRRGQQGYSLTELLVTLAILMLVSSIMAAGAPAALRAYMNVVDASDAHTLLSTTASRLRDELSMADPSGLTNGEITSFVSLETGYNVSFDYDEECFLQKKEWANGKTESTATPTPLLPKKTSASARSSQGLRAVYESITYKDGIFTVKKLKVIKMQGEEEVEGKTRPKGPTVGGAEYSKLEIRVLAAE